MKKTRPLLPPFLAITLAACGAPAEEAPGRLAQASICGSTTDWQDVEPWAAAEGTTWAKRINRAQRAVAQIRRRSDSAAICTGYLIAENLGLTAGHCFSSAADAPDYDFVFDYQLDASSASRSTTTVQITSGLEHSTGTGSDYALVRLASNAGATFGSIPVVNSLPAASSTLGIVQHPLGLMKKFHDGTYGGLSSGQLTYGDLDTDNGSSGSPVISSDYEVVGVHTNGGCSTSSGSNKATAMTDVYSLSTIIPKLVRIRAAGFPTPLGTVALAATIKSCSRSGNYYDMANGCGLQVLIPGSTVTATCDAGTSGHTITSFTATGAVMTSSCTATSCSGTFTYAGAGVDVTCRYAL